MVYGKIGKPPIGTNRFPGWEANARPARFDLTKGKVKGGGSGGKGKSKSGKGKGKKSDRDENTVKGKTSPSLRAGRIGTMRRSQLYKRLVHLIIMWQPMCKGYLTFLPFG